VGGTIPATVGMPSHLQIPNRRERALVRAADMLLAPLAWARPTPPSSIRRVLLMRLERIGDLLMTLDAIDAARHAWPEAAIDLAVGSWNRDLAAMIPGVSTIHVVDVPWLSRGEQPTSWTRLIAEARRWRTLEYDAVINFEPDIRTNLFAGITGAPLRAGYWTGGGGALLTSALPFHPDSHVSDNAARLIAHIAPPGARPVAPAREPRLVVPSDVRESAVRRLSGLRRPWIGIHASGGRPSKQWHLDRFAEVGRRLARETGGSLVLTGGPADVPLVEAVRGALSDAPSLSVADAGDLRESAGILAALDVLVSGDTGPMHLAAAVGTPVVALFGPADPKRYGPRGARERIVRVDLHCSPCGLVRLPPERCRGHVPDCMDGITVDVVVRAALDLLHESAPAASHA
jgi:ADP-heptose:LPS heptosyltransferase